MKLLWIALFYFVKFADADELLERRPFVVPRALGGGGGGQGNQQESEEEEEEIEANDNGKKRSVLHELGAYVFAWPNCIFHNLIWQQMDCIESS